MDRVFNRGLGMTLLVAAGSADGALAALGAADVEASVVGEVAAGSSGVRFA